jgi:DNA-binding PadR family transcriptional regulator
MMVLGLVAVEAGTVADTQRRLADRFPGTAFPKNSAHTNLPKLKDEGYVRMIGRGAKLSQDRYEVTDQGIGYLQEWIASFPPLPALRDPIHSRIEFAGLEGIASIEHLESILLHVRDQEKRCLAISDDAHEKLLAEQRLLARSSRKTWTERLSADLRLLRLKYVKLSWADEEDRRKSFGDELEEIIARHAGPGR